jgi:hypothetical protein
MAEVSRGGLRPSCRPERTSPLMKRRREGRVSTDTRGPRAANKHAVEPQVQPNIRPSLRNGFSGYRRSPRGSAVLPPSPADHHHRRLGISTAMPGPHHFAVASLRSSARAFDTRLQSNAPVASPARRFMTIAKRPSSASRDALICGGDLPDVTRDKCATNWHDRQLAHAGHPMIARRADD